MKGVRVLGLCDDPPGYLPTASGDEGSFEIGPLVPGEFRLAAKAAGGFADSPYVAASAGDGGVVLTLTAACIAQLRAVDSLTGEPCSASFIIMARPPLKWGRGGLQSLDPSSAAAGVNSMGMPEGTYDITALTEDGRVGLLSGVEIQSAASPQELTVRVDVGARLRLRLEGRSPSIQVDVLFRGIQVGFSALRPNASSLVFVPAGTVTVRLKFRDRVLEEREVTAILGEEVEVLFRRD